MATHIPSLPYPWPLDGYEGLEPLSEEKTDGKSLLNPASPNGTRSPSYEAFPDPLDRGRGGFDVHVYHDQKNPAQASFARALWERIRREFPELRIYAFHTRPVGPHATAMFEVNVLTPAQFGAFVPWLVVHRGPLSVLIHPNTVVDGVDRVDEMRRNHTTRAIWLGERVPLDLGNLPRRHFLVYSAAMLSTGLLLLLPLAISLGYASQEAPLGPTEDGIPGYVLEYARRPTDRRTSGSIWRTRRRRWTDGR
ncbi:hypothetical protein VTN02DRAFT_6721 [Thermoascus thermophilus]